MYPPLQGNVDTLSLCPVEPLLSFSLKSPDCFVLTLLVIKGVDFCAFYSWPQTFLPPTSPSQTKLPFRKANWFREAQRFFRVLEQRPALSLLRPPSSAMPSLLPAHPLAGSALLSWCCAPPSAPPLTHLALPAERGVMERQGGATSWTP